MFRKKLFGNNISQNCEYCKLVQSGDGNDLNCKKYGSLRQDEICKSFVYDPLKRTPQKAPNFAIFSKDDFAI